MTVPLLSLTALKPAASLARSAASGGAQIGSNFLSMLSKITSPDGSADDAIAPDPAKTGEAAKDSDPANTWSQRFTTWLRQQPWIASTVSKSAGGQAGSTKDPSSSADQPLNIELSLDAMDQPHVAINGTEQADLNAALASDPSWLDQFRDMALDRAEALGNFATAQATPLTLTIQQESATMAPVIKWK